MAPGEGFALSLRCTDLAAQAESSRITSRCSTNSGLHSLIATISRSFQKDRRHLNRTHSGMGLTSDEPSNKFLEENMFRNSTVYKYTPGAMLRYDYCFLGCDDRKEGKEAGL